MSEWIRLNGSKVDRPISVRASTILAVEPAEGGGCTLTTGNVDIHVQETYEEVMALFGVRTDGTGEKAK